MNVISQFIKFLKEYNKLLERGTKNIYDNAFFIWVDDLAELQKNSDCNSIITDLFLEELDNASLILTLKKPLKPIINIPTAYLGKISFNEAKNIFESFSDNPLEEFKETDEAKIELLKLEHFKKAKLIYSKLFKAYNNTTSDTNQEIVLSVGLIQYTKLSERKEKTNNVKTNQHLFHFPLKIELLTNNAIKLSLSEEDKPYVDAFFLNNTPIKKERLDNVVDKFESEIESHGYKYLFSKGFKDIISNDLQQISDNSFFTNSNTKPSSDEVKLDMFGISFSPAISFKAKKPRFFEKLTESIINFDKDNSPEVTLFNLLLRNPNSLQDNRQPRTNYFTQDLFEQHKTSNSNSSLAIDDFSTFFPLSSNKEQKEIYEKYLQNKLTVVTGPPGTGKSHTIVNILCSLLAEGKRVLITAQTDKALESLLEKIPIIFDDLIFTKIKLANSERFSLEKSVDGISDILKRDRHFDIVKKIEKLNFLKSHYTKFKNEVNSILSFEYKTFSINESFKDLKNHQIFDRLTSKDQAEWNWIKDDINEDFLESYDEIERAFHSYSSLYNNTDSEIKTNFDLQNYIEDIEQFDVDRYFNLQNLIKENKTHLDLSESKRNNLSQINIDSIKDLLVNYSNSDLVVKNIQVLNKLLAKHKLLPELNTDLYSNLSHEEILENKVKYIRDIQLYLSLIPVDGETIPFFKRQINSSFKQVKYIERISINDQICNTRTSLNKLKQYIIHLSDIYDYIIDITNNGYKTSSNNAITLNTKIKIHNDLVNQMAINFNLLETLQTNIDIENYIQIFKLDRFDVENLYRKTIDFGYKFKLIQEYEKDLSLLQISLNGLNDRLQNSDLSFRFRLYYPFGNIDKTESFSEIKTLLRKIQNLIDSQSRFNKSKSLLENFLPKTIEKLTNVPGHLFKKENFEYSAAHKHLISCNSINIQYSKEQLNYYFDEISKIKCEILYDLARNNFQTKFTQAEINEFINLLNKYKYNWEQGNRGIQNNASFKNLARGNSIEISQRLTCWVMKFNDVLNSIGSEPETFDCIIIDEASQLDFNSLLLGYYAKSMIIVGDDKQTSPSGLSSVSQDDLNIIRDRNLDFLADEKIHIKTDNSLFSLAKMVAGTSNLSLNEHFRCVPEIIAFSKRQFYDNSLRSLKQLNANRLEPKKCIFVESSFLENKKVLKEIESIKLYISDLFDNPSYENKSIGVVSLGSADHTDKLSEIIEELSEIFDHNKIKKHNLIVADASKFQGDERDVMIVSLGVALDFEKISKDDDAKPNRIIKNDQFLTDSLKSINVALSRAKEQMILFHSIRPEDLKAGDFRIEIINFFKEEFQSIAEFILPENISKPNRTRQNVPEPFDSWFEYDIADVLIQYGYSFIKPQHEVKESEVWENPKTGQKSYVHFKLDLVVFSNSQLIAIECDGDPFHSTDEDVAYDIERQEFLERVGWKIYRILYSVYKQKPDEEVKKLIEFVERHSKPLYNTLLK